MIILGVNAYHAEASACLLRDGVLVAAAEEERFRRLKHVAGFPKEAVRFCLRQGAIRPEDLDEIAVSRNPWAHWAGKLSAGARFAARPAAIWDRLKNLSSVSNIPAALAEALGVEERRLKSARLRQVEHHRAHIASSFYPSGWEEAAVLSLDGFGDFMSGMWGAGRGKTLTLTGGAAFPHSLGVLYTALTQFLGFRHWGDEYKVMGLAAYGDPAPYRNALSDLVRSAGRGGYRLNLAYFRHAALNASMTWAEGAPRLGRLYSESLSALLGPARAPEAPLEERHADIAAALQERLEEVVFPLMRRLAETTGMNRLCYAGGVALNCLLNGKISRATPFQEIFIQPAAHDAGTSLGAALYAAHHVHRRPRSFVMRTAAWGPCADESACRQAADGARAERLDETVLCRRAAQALSQGKIVGWFQGRMEFGPRALGHRSLLADPRDPAMKERLNRRVKRRESFRPFSPSILRERVDRYFPGAQPDPFMLFARPADPANGKGIPAALHVDGTGRLQAVHRDSEPLFWNLIREFERLTGTPVLLNTSFNEQEPIVCTPGEAVACFRRNAVDCLALGPFWIER